jgi:hypothetical protein
MAVEKLPFRPKTAKIWDRKCPGDLGKSSVGHPDAILILLISREGNFSTPTPDFDSHTSENGFLPEFGLSLYLPRGAIWAAGRWLELRQKAKGIGRPLTCPLLSGSNPFRVMQRQPFFGSDSETISRVFKPAGVLAKLRGRDGLGSNREQRVFCRRPTASAAEPGICRTSGAAPQRALGIAGGPSLAASSRSSQVGEDGKA